LEENSDQGEEEGYKFEPCHRTEKMLYQKHGKNVIRAFGGIIIKDQ